MDQQQAPTGGIDVVADEGGDAVDGDGGHGVRGELHDALDEAEDAVTESIIAVLIQGSSNSGACGFGINYEIQLLLHPSSVPSAMARSSP